jgi:hypothetical protein
MKEVREYFDLNYGHIDFWSVSDQDITEFLERGYLKGLSFERKMDCFCDYLMANQLVDYTE